MNPHYIGILFLTPLLVLVGSKWKHSNPLHAFLGSLGGTTFLVIWVVLTGRATFVDCVALDFNHRFAAYLMGGYSVVMASLILLLIEKKSSR